MSLWDEFTDRNERLAKSGGLSMFQDLKHDLGLGSKPKASTYASDAFAALTRQQWSDYLKDVAPYEDKLVEFSNSTTAAADAQTNALTNIDSAFERQAGATQDRLKGLGLKLNADEQKAADRTNMLTKSLAETQAVTQAGMQTRSLQQALLGNPTPDVQGLSS